MAPEKLERFDPPSKAKTRQLLASTGLLLVAWFVAVALCLTVIENVLGPMEKAVVTLKDPDVPG